MLATETQRGAFAPGTTKRNTKNMYDITAPVFEPGPDGPYEAPTVNDQPTAQDHFNATREIKLREPRGSNLPDTSYRDHYPPKQVPQPGQPLELDNGTQPFTAQTTYDTEYWDKPRAARPIDPKYYTPRPAPFISLNTTNNDTYKPFEVAPPAGTSERPTRPATLPPPSMPSIYDTTYRREYPKKDGPARQPPSDPEPRDPMPWLNDGTTYRNHYVPKPLALVPPPDQDPHNPYPFAGNTEYRAEYVPKEADPQLPPLTGVRAKEGIQLPLPRRSLGVEFWHKGQTNQYFVLIPRSMDVPCAGRQVFTTVHDNQEQACILVLYGDDPVASNNTLLGQFDIVNIPPAPKDVPRIEVVFHLSKDLFLTAEARDLDTMRHKLWLQRGEIIVLRA